MWFLTLITIGLVFTGNQYWWIPVAFSGVYLVYAVAPDRQPAARRR